MQPPNVAIAPAQLSLAPGRPSALTWAAVCTAIVAVIAVIDYLTGYELSLSILYLTPVLLATWTLGRNAGVTFSVVSLFAWLVSDHLMGHEYAHPFYHFWEAAIRIVTWVGFALLLCKLKAALARADERFVTVLARLDAVVYVADRSSGEVLYRNERCEEAFGADLASATDIERRLRAGLGNDEAEVSGTGPTSSEVQDRVTGRWYLLAARTIRWIDGRGVELCIATDVTDRKRTEQLARRQQERLEMTARLTTLGEVASTLAHEINQPLAAVSNYCRGCVRRLRSGDWKREELLDALEKCALQAERAAGVIQRARELLRRRDPAPVACDINAVIAAVARTAEGEVARAGGKLHLRVEPTLPQALADPIMIELVLLNLVKNGFEAMRFTPAPARELIIRSRTEGEHGVCIEVEDRGEGLPVQLKDDLFIPFFTTKANGMGMGLSICRSIVERHRGRMWATPNPAGGSIFYFTLPRLPA